jgi:hypothetical protein
MGKLITLDADLALKQFVYQRASNFLATRMGFRNHRSSRERMLS